MTQTRTLRDYRPQHDEDCAVHCCANCVGYRGDPFRHGYGKACDDFLPRPCDCGLDALLAQPPAQGEIEALLGPEDTDEFIDIGLDAVVRVAPVTPEPPDTVGWGNVSPMVERAIASEARPTTEEGARLHAGPVTSWKTAAKILGEHLATVGPNGYGNFTPDEWLTWARSALAAQAQEIERLKADLAFYQGAAEARQEPR